MSRWKERRLWRYAVAVVVIAAVAGWWSTGRMDPLLWKIGLNARECGVQSRTGNVACGEQWKLIRQPTVETEEKAANRRYEEKWGNEDE